MAQTPYDGDGNGGGGGGGGGGSIIPGSGTSGVSGISGTSGTSGVIPPGGGGGNTSDSGDLTITGYGNGNIPNAITVKDSKGNVLNLSVSCQVIHVAPRPKINPISIVPQVSSISYIGGSTTLQVSGGGTSYRKIQWITNGAANAFTINRPGPVSGDPEEITFYARQGGFFQGTINGGPPSQPETEFEIHVNRSSGGGGT